MASTELKIGVATSARPSSRVLKPPGGGHTNIFGEPEVAVNAPRPKYNQQNSSNLNACMGSTDPNIAVEKLREVVQTPPMTTNEESAHNKSEANKSHVLNGSYNSGNNNANNAGNTNSRSGRVPPGGFSSGGFW